MYSSWKNKNVNDLNYGYLCTSSWFLFTWFSQKKKKNNNTKNNNKKLNKLSTKNIKEILCLKLTFPLHKFVLNLTSHSVFNFFASYFTLREYFYNRENMAEIFILRFICRNPVYLIPARLEYIILY